MLVATGIFQLKMLDLTKADWLPQDWLHQIHVVVATHTVQTVLDGKSSTSREAAEASPISVGVVTGEIIRSRITWLFDLYAGPLLEWSSTVTGEPLSIAEDVGCSVNINVIRGTGSGSERHVDSNPVTGLLYASTLSEGDGGATVFDHPNGSDKVYPREGLFIAFDATDTPHYVAPLKRELTRLSIPMNYYRRGHSQARPADLDSYLYSGTNKPM